MRRFSIAARMWVFLCLLPLFAPTQFEARCAELKAHTLEGFASYVKATEARIDAEIARPAAFLHMDGLPEAVRAPMLASLKRGDIHMQRLETRTAAGREITAADALIHHWLGAAFIPQASVGAAITLVQDYDRHKDIFKPEVVGSRLVSRDGNDFKIYYRLRKKKVITVTLNTDHDVRYFPVSASRNYSRSYSTRIQEVENAENPGEREKPVGKDNGFLWRINSYWRFEEKDDGLYVECESISLTRDIPWVVSFIVKPFVTDIPKESLQMTLGSMRGALLPKAPAAPVK